MQAAKDTGPAKNKKKEADLSRSILGCCRAGMDTSFPFFFFFFGKEGKSVTHHITYSTKKIPPQKNSYD